MIDALVFADGMGKLAGNFGREIDPPVSAEYYKALTPHLDNTQFVDCVTRAIAGETFWPPAAKLLELAGVSPSQRSEGALRMVSDALFQHGGYRFIPGDIPQSWDAATWAGIREVGGLKEITNCTEEKWPAMQRRFQRAYEAHLAPGKTLPRGGLQPQAARLVKSTLKLIGAQDRAAGDASE